MRHILRISLSIFLASTSILSYAQTIESILSVPWDTENGIMTVTKLDPQCVTDFTIVNDSTIAILCVAESKVKTYSTVSNKCIHDFSYKHDANFVAFDGITNKFYLAGISSVYEYSYDGEMIQKTIIGEENTQFIVDLKAEDGDLTISGPSFTSYKLIENGIIKSQEDMMLSKRESKLLNDRMYVSPVNWKRLVENSQMILYNDTTRLNTIDIGVESETLGIINKQLAIVQLKENVDDKSHKSMLQQKQILLLSIDDSRIVSKIDIPNINRCYQNIDFRVRGDDIYHLLSAQDSLYVIRISIPETNNKTKNISSIKYPEKFDYGYK